MTSPSRQRHVNPRLGIYFGIFTSAFAALVLLVMLFEQLGVAPTALRAIMLFGPIALYLLIGGRGLTQDAGEYFAAGRRVPAFYNGAVLALTAAGGTGVVAMTGVFFLHGYDGWCIASGLVAGCVVMGVLIGPFLRKFGGYTVATFLGRRFDSKTVRIAAAALLSVPMLLFLAAELSVAVFAASWLTGYAPRGLLALALATVIATAVLGGMRSVTWSAAAQAIVVILALVVPASLVAVLEGNLPVPQLSHGPTLRAIGRLEVLQGVPIPIVSDFAFEIAGTELTAITQRLATPFGSVGPGGYVIMVLTVMAGIAAAPWLLPRFVTTPGVYETRKSAGWATVILGIVMLTLSGSAIYMRDVVMTTLVGQSASSLPEWFHAMVSVGYAGYDDISLRLPLTSLSFKRDAVLFILPIAAGFPAVVLYFALAGAVAAALAGAAAVATALANTIAEDIVCGLSWAPIKTSLRLAIARASLVAACVAGALLSVSADSDPLRLLFWALALTGSTAFPVLVLAIWWKRLTTAGALAGLMTGFAAATLAILAGEVGLIGIRSPLAGAVGIPVSTLVTLLVSTQLGAANRISVELVNDMRIPGGDTIYDREIRLLRLKQQR